MRRTIATGLFLVVLCSPAFGYRLLYKEQLYQMNHQQLYMYPEDYAANIAWLEFALDADFANPLYALAEIETPQHWEFYRALFWVHLNLHMVNQYLGWARGYVKFDARFYNYPWREENLEAFERADSLFDIALYYWEEAVGWSEEAAGFRWLELEEIQHWSDQSFRIQSGDLDYDAIIFRHRERLAEVRAQFLAMDESTY